MIIPNDIIIQPSKNGKWILYNVFTKNCLATTTDVLEIISEIDSGVEIKKIIKINKERKFKVWNIERFSNFDGLLADPTRMIRDISKWPDPNIYVISELIEICKQKYIIVDNYQKYLEPYFPIF